MMKRCISLLSIYDSYSIFFLFLQNGVGGNNNAVLNEHAVIAWMNDLIGWLMDLFLRRRWLTHSTPSRHVAATPTLLFLVYMYIVKDDSSAALPQPLQASDAYRESMALYGLTHSRVSCVHMESWAISCCGRDYDVSSYIWTLKSV